jgi:Quinohemoprotein amine dehydrogenase A, alpha subunit, haem binding
LQTTGAAPGAPPVPTASESEPAILTKACLTCHDRDLIAQQRLARSGWVREVEKMMRWGAQLSDTEKAALVDYLAQQYPVR